MKEKWSPELQQMTGGVSGFRMRDNVRASLRVGSYTFQNVFAFVIDFTGMSHDSSVVKMNYFKPVAHPSVSFFSVSLAEIR